MGQPIEGTWSKTDLRRAFVAGAKWWQYHNMSITMWPSEIKRTKVEAEKRYPEGKCRIARKEQK